MNSPIIPIVPLSGAISNGQKLSGTISELNSKISGEVSSDILAAKKYAGPYEVFPRKVDQLLNTSDKLLTDDIKVDAIRYSEVSNPEGGVTINIGYE